jgi:hypothetical protein
MTRSTLSRAGPTSTSEKHLRRAELKVAQANAWLAMARELAWQRDDYGGRAAR